MIKIITAKHIDNNLEVPCYSGTEVVILKSFNTCYGTEQKNAHTDTIGNPGPQHEKRGTPLRDRGERNLVMLN